MLLKILLHGYYRGTVSSRRIAEACCRDVVFMALSADPRPHFTSIASFVRKLKHEIASLFGDVLLYASALGSSARSTSRSMGASCPRMSEARNGRASERSAD